MATIVFNSPDYAKRLEDAGFTSKQAEVQAGIICGIIDDKLAKRQNLREMAMRLRYDLTMRPGAIVVACTTILIADMQMVLR